MGRDSICQCGIRRSGLQSGADHDRPVVGIVDLGNDPVNRQTRVAERSPGRHAYIIEAQVFDSIDQVAG